MAVYGRSREKWDPTKRKSKVSKNRTYELGSSLVSGKVMFYWDVDAIVSDQLGTRIDGPIDINGEEPLRLYKDNNLESNIHRVSAAHFEPSAVAFPKNSTDNISIQSDGVSTHGFSLADVAKSGRNYDVYLSYWIKLSQLNFGTSKGHSMGGFYRGIPNPIATQPAQDTAIATLKPALILGITSSGAPEIRFHRDGVTGTFMRFAGPSGSEDHKVVEDKWTHVTMLIKGYTGAPTSGMVSMWIDGSPIQVTQSLVGTGSTNSNWNSWFTADTDPLGSLIGNHTKGFAADNTGGASDGFFGSFGQLLLFSQPVTLSTTEETRNQMAKFVYEAQREGAYHLHSGIHSSSPRLEQLDLDRDSLYPPNFTLENYTMGAYQPPQERVGGVLTNSDRISARSESHFVEGFNPVDSGYAWKENASQYFINKNTGILPHLRLHHSDSLIGSGNWYSDARSEFFNEDLDSSTGFIVNDQASDELYREHYTEDTAQKFVEIDIPDDYKDCFVIDIPIPNTADLTLGTDRPSVNENRRIAGTTVVSNPQAKIANMAYYNFASEQWETVLDTDYDLSASTPKDTNFIDKNDIGFSPMTGLVVPNHEAHAQRILPKYGLPTSDYGFPFDDKFNASAGQSIDLSKYIDQPVILEGWEIQTKVVPVVGYAGYTATNQNSTFYSTVGSGGKSPFHYGGHGESAVFFNHRRNMTGFDQNVIQDGSDYFHVGTTIPTTYESGGAESQPPIEQPGLVTSGITAFLLKKSKITNTSSLRDAYQATAADKTINKHSNCLSNAEGVAWSAANGSGTLANKFQPMNEHMPDGAGVAAHPEWVNPSTDWSNYESSSLIGWLQQVYHNDEHLESYPTRNNWVRNTDTGNAYRITEGKQIVDMLGKEKATYVQNLLYTNTEEVDLNVRGNTKTVGKIVDGMPVTNFFITSHGGVGLGVFKSSSDDSGRYAVSTSSETSMNVGDGSLGDHSIVPRYGAGDSTKTTIMPRLNMPTKVVSSSDTINTFHKEVKMFESIEDDSTVILSPNDELVLGIQNSISTTFASQQIKGASTNFVRWGRTSLKIPQQTASQTASFVRLYVKKTRSDNDFNIIADSSNYNSNVSRDLGDHAVADQFRTNNVTMYSGSIADDIVGPTYFDPPDITQRWEESPAVFNAPILDFSTTVFNYAALEAWTIAYTGSTWDLSSRAAGTYYPFFGETSTGLLNSGEYTGTGKPLEGRTWSGSYFDLEPTDYTINWKGLSQRAFDYDSSGGNPMGNTSSTPHVTLQFPLFTIDGSTGCIAELNVFKSVRNCLQSVLVHPANLFLKKPTTNSTQGQYAWYPSIPNGDHRRYTGSGTFWRGPNGDGSGNYWEAMPSTNSSYSVYIARNSADRFGAGATSILEELDDRDTNTRDYTDIQWTDVNGDVQHFDLDYHKIVSPSNVGSSWFQKFSFPILQRNLEALEPSFATAGVEFRHVRIATFGGLTNQGGVKIDGSNPAIYVNSNTANQQQGYGIPYPNKYPIYPGTTRELDIGDAFYIDGNGDAVRLFTKAEVETAIRTGTSLSGQDWARQWQATKSSRGNQVIYIVAGKHFLWTDTNSSGNRTLPIVFADDGTQMMSPSTKMKVLTNGSIVEDTRYPEDLGVYTYLQVYQKIVDVLSAAILVDKGLLWESVKIEDGNIVIRYPDDPIIRTVLENYKTDIDNQNLFKLMGLRVAPRGEPSGGGYTTRNALFDNDAILYLKINPAEASSKSHWWTNTSEPGNDSTQNQNLLNWKNFLTDLSDTSSSSWTVGGAGGNFVKGYIPKHFKTSGNYVARTLPAGIAAGNLLVNWAGLPESASTIQITQETFTRNVPHIDRKVAFRTSRGDAGPFGSLNPFKRVAARNAIWDSIAPKLDVLKSGSIDLTQEGYPQGWLLDGQEGKEFKPILSDVKTRVDMSTPNQFASQFTQDSYPIVTTDLYADGSNDYQWTPINNSNSSSNWPTLFTNGIFPIKNYIELEFSGLKDYSSKTGRDLILGFGNAPSSRHVVRPDKYKYTAFQTYTSVGPTTNTNPTTSQATIVVDLTMDPPRGARFGLYNTEHSFPTYIFSNNSYGQLRDMFEQALDTKTTTFRKDEKIFGSPVVVNPINPSNTEVPKLMANTSRYNKTTNATITKPFIEDNYEAIPNPPNLNSETLRVDVAGSIRTKSVLAPGNTAANIRRRG